MSTSVVLPALGESVTEGTITRWLKNVGDTVQEDEALLEVSTDKVDTEVPSPVTGVIEELLFGEDDTVEVGAVLAKIGDGSDSPAEPAAPAAETAEAPAAEAPAPAAEAPAPAAEAPAPAAEAPAASGDATDVVLPELGESVTEGTITRWLKNVGDAVDVDEPLLEISTDKVDTEVPSPVAGTVLELLAGEDDTVEVGSVLARVGSGAPAAAEAPAAEAPAPAAEAPAAEAPAPAAEAPAPAAEAPAAEAPAPVAESPCRTCSRSRGVCPRGSLGGDHARPVGSVGERQGLRHASRSPTRRPTGRRSDDRSGLGRGRTHPQGGRAQGDIRSGRIRCGTGPRRSSRPHRCAAQTQPMTRLRKVSQAVESMTSTAQLTTVVEVDVTAVAALRSGVKDEFLAKTGNKLSFMPFFALAAAEALKAYPIINSTLDGENIVYPASENLSIAVDTERGLLTPVVRDAGDKNLAQIAGDIADLAARTRNNKLKPDELAGGTFTLTNTGSRGALFDTPVVFLPQSAILGTGIVYKRPGVVSTDAGEAIGIRSYVYLALSYDHRTIDGADAARFLSAMKARLEAAEFTADLGM